MVEFWYKVGVIVRRVWNNGIGVNVIYDVKIKQHVQIWMAACKDIYSISKSSAHL